MDPTALFALSVLRTLTASLGAIIFLLGARAWRLTRRSTLGWFTLGVGLLTLGYALEGALFQIFGWPLETASAIEASITLVALSVLVYGLFSRETARGGSRARAASDAQATPRT